MKVSQLYRVALTASMMLILSSRLDMRGFAQKVADAGSELLQNVFGKDKNTCRSVYPVASLPLGVPLELEVILEVVA
jgi:hypothetical protein